MQQTCTGAEKGLHAQRREGIKTSYLLGVFGVPGTCGVLGPLLSTKRFSSSSLVSSTVSLFLKVRGPGVTNTEPSSVLKADMVESLQSKNRQSNI